MVEDKNSQRGQGKTDRRRVLTALGGAATMSIAGCLGGGDGGDVGGSDPTSTSGGDGSPSGSSVLGEATFDGVELKVELTDDSVAGVNAFRAGEESVRQTCRPEPPQ